MNTVTQLYNMSPEEIKEEFKFINEKIENLSKNFQPKEPSTWLTRKEVCEMLSISYVTLHSWTNKNILIAHKIGNQVRYLRSQVEAAMKKTR